MDFGEVIGFGTATSRRSGSDRSPTPPTGRSTSPSSPPTGPRSAFFDAAVGTGAEVLHAPRLWPEYHPAYYGAFVRDPDGNNVEAVCHGPE